MDGNKLKIQDYLSFGYLYLLILGILRDSIYYGLLDINIMSYSNIMDVLLSPIAYLVSHPVLFVIFLFIIYLVAIQPKFHEKNREKKWYGKIFDVKKRDERYSKPQLISGEMVLAILLIASMLLGTGIGAGIKRAEKMKANEFEMSHTLKFLDGEEKEVKIIGQNSNYVFYVQENDRSVTVSPINGVIKSIEKK